MSGQNKVSGIVLAGGQARRMRLRDKGLVEYRSQPLVRYALAAMEPLVDELLISANRNLELYRRFGYRVISDETSSFDGPLAGILSAMRAVENPLLLVAPCDSPLATSAHLARLLASLDADADIAVAFDGERLHPVFLALRTCLKDSLRDYLQSGGRKLQDWLYLHRPRLADFSDAPEVFLNINTLEELAALERS